MTLSLPLNFGDRPCDRLFLRILNERCGLSRETLSWMMLMVWRDFGTARDDRRQVPRDPAERAVSPAVAIIEEFIGWKGVRGAFIEAAITSGFFVLTDLDENLEEMVLVDFFPANAAVSTISNSGLGGVMKSYNRAKISASATASDQLKLFEKQGGVPMPGVHPRDLKQAIQFVHEICNCLRRQPPQDEVWKSTILAKAVEAIGRHDEQEREAVLKWFVKNRQDPKIPIRLDFILDGFEKFIPLARGVFSKL